MSATLVVFYDLIEFQVRQVLWVTDPEDCLQVTLLNGNRFLIRWEEGGMTWEVFGCSVTVFNWPLSVVIEFGEVNDTPIPADILEDFLFAPEYSLGDGME